MAVNIKLKRSAVQGNVPTTSQLELGELALNTYDGKAFFKKDVNGTQSIVELASTGSTVASASYAAYAALAGTASFAITAASSSYALSASYSATATSASYALSASNSTNTISSSYALSASYAQTSSYATNFNVSGNLVVGGNITAQTLHVQTITSSVIFSSGSNILGDATNDTQTLIGTVNISGSLNVTGSATINNLTGSLFGTASWALDAVNAINAPRYTLTSSFQNFTQSYYADSASVSTRVVNLEQFSASILNYTASTDAKITALNLATASLNAFSASILNYTASNNANITSLNAQTASLLLATASINAFSASMMAFTASYNTGSFIGSFTGSFSGSLNNFQGTARHIPFFSSSQVLADSSLYQVGNSSVAINQNAVTTAAPEALYVWQPSTSSFNVISGKGNLDTYLQLNIQNVNQGISASSDVVATANNGNEFTNYIDMGINSENFSGFLGGPNDAYVYAAGNEFHIGNITPNKHLGFFVGGGNVDEGNKFALYPNNQHQMTGSLDVSGSVKAFNFTGSLLGTASFANNTTSASYAFNATSASYAITASYALNVPDTASFAVSSSYAQTASFVQNAQSASYVLNAISASYAVTASSADDFLVRGTLTAQTIIAQTITSSVSFVTGSTKFGTITSNTHQFTGSVSVSGSLAVNNSNVILTNQTSSMSVLSASFASTASFVQNAQSASFVQNAQTASYVLNAVSSSFASTASFVQTAQTASYVLNAVSSSFASSGTGNFSGSFSGSFFGNGAGLTNISASSVVGLNLSQIASGSVTASVDPAYGFKVNSNTTITGSTQITGSLGVTGSVSITGSGTVLTANVDTISFTGSFAQLGSVTVVGGVNATSFTGSLLGTASFATSASQAQNAVSASYVLSAVSASFASTASFVQTAQTASFVTTAQTASFVTLAQTASFVTTAQTASFVQNAQTASLAVTASSADNFLVRGTLTAQTIVAQVITSSTDFVTGSTRFGTIVTNTHQFTGSVSISGSLAVNGSNAILTNQTSSMSVLSASFASTASFVQNAQTASFVSTASFTTTASFASTASFVSGAVYTTGNQTISGGKTFTDNTTFNGIIYMDGVGSVNSMLSFKQPSTLGYPGPGYSGIGAFNNNQIQLYYNQGGLDYKVVTFNSSNVALNDTVTLNFPTTGGTLLVSNLLTGSVATSSLALTASYVLNAVSASYAANADLLDGKDSTIFATTGSNIFKGNQTVTGSLFTSGSNTLVGSTTLTGSLLVSGSTTQIGNNTLTGNTVLSGSLLVSGSQGLPTATIGFFGDIDVTGTIGLLPVNKNIDTTLSGSYIYVSGSTQDLYFAQNSKGYTNTTRLRWLEGNLYTGLLNGGLITAATGSTTYQVSSGSGIIVNLNASLNDNPYPTIQYLNWGNLSASIAPLTASYQQAFVSIDSTGNIYQQGTPYAAGQFDTEINIGVVLFQNGSTINGVKTQPTVAYGFEQQQNIFNRAFGPLKLSGYTLAPSGSSTRSLIVAGGTAYSPGSNYSIDPNNPSYTTDSGTNVSKIFRYRQSGSTWVYDTNAGAGYTTIDPTQYSDNGVLTAVPGGGSNREFSIQRVFWFPNSVAKAIVVYYGNATYASLTEATSNIAFEPFVEAPNTAANAIYLGAIIVRNDADFTNTDTYAIQAGGLFRSVGGSGGGGSVITQTLAGLSDVSISGPTSGQALVYDTTAAKWRNLSFISASISGNAVSATSASYAATASFVTLAQTASFVQNAVTASYVLNAVSSSFASTASFVTLAQTASFVQNAQTASFVQNAQTASYVLNAVSSSFAATASSADNFLVRGTLTAQTIVAQTITSSTDFVTGSTRFGSLLSNTHQFTGSVSITGSLTSPNITGSLLGTASFANNATSASYAFNATSASFATTASYAFNATSASHALTSSYSNNIIGAANYIPKFTGGNSLSSSIMYENATGIGINDLVPTHKLQVNGDVSAYNSNSTLNSTKYAFLPALNLTTVGTETNQWANVGIYGALGFSATASTFTPQDNSFVSAFFGNVVKSGAGNVSGKMSSYAAGVNFSGAGNVTTVAGFRAYAPLQSFALPSFSGTLTNYIGLLIDDITGTTDVGSRITNKYGIYQSGSLDRNYFAGSTTFAGGITGSLEGTASYAVTASYALNAGSGGGGGLSALYIQDEGITQGTASYINFTGTGVTATVTAGTASISITGGGSSGTGQSVLFTQASPATTWTFSHNLNNQYVNYDVYDSNSNAIIPANVSASNANTLIISFGVATAGYAVATVGGGLPFISGSFNGYVLTVSGSAAAWAPPSSLSVLSASYANNAAQAATASYVVLAQTASFVQNAQTASFVTLAQTASFVTLAQTASFVQNAQTASYVLNAISASFASTAVQAQTASFVTTAQTASFVQNAQTASYVLNAISSSFASTASSADNFTVRGTLTAQTIIAQTVTSSIVYSSGSNIFGNSLANTQVLTGSVTITGSLAVNNSNVILTNQTSSMSVATASYVLNAVSASFATQAANATTASYVLNAISSSFATNAATATTASFVQNAVSASFASNANSASFALVATSASFAATASYATNLTVASTLTLDATLTDYASVASSIVGSNNLFTQNTGSYTSAFFKYTARNGSNTRAGEVISAWNGIAITYTDFSTVDIGDTSAVTASISIVSGQAQFNVQTNSSGWNIKSIATFM